MDKKRIRKKTNIYRPEIEDLRPQLMPSKIKKKNYRCSICNSIKHNKKTCKYTSKEDLAALCLILISKKFIT